ncbi:MAG: hypothetical protein JNL85_14220 [Rubrivivax sp.]|nr:hypothetical protein [Rubrivivax sp.]
MKGLLFGLGGLILAAIALWGIWGVGQWRWSAKTRNLLDRLEAARANAPGERFDPRELQGLPAPVARHLRQVLPDGTAIVRAVDVVHRGTFNMSQDGGEQWKPFTSRQRVVTRRPGFVWDGRVMMAPGLAVHVHDAYVDGEGILEPAVAGLLTLANLRDRQEVARGELMRFLAEAAWYPTALLPSQGLRWEPIDERSARATLADGPIRLSMTFRFGADGLIESVRAEDRGRTVDGRVVPTPWEGRLSNYQRRDGLLVPLEGEVAWLTPQGRLPYWRGTIEAIAYQR